MLDQHHNETHNPNFVNYCILLGLEEFVPNITKITSGPSLPQMLPQYQTFFMALFKPFVHNKLEVNS